MIYAYESNDPNEIKKLYEEAKNKIQLQNIYKELCIAYCQEMELQDTTKSSKTK